MAGAIRPVTWQYCGVSPLSSTISAEIMVRFGTLIMAWQGASSFGGFASAAWAARPVVLAIASRKITPNKVSTLRTLIIAQASKEIAALEYHFQRKLNLPGCRRCRGDQAGGGGGNAGGVGEYALGRLPEIGPVDDVEDF